MPDTAECAGEAQVRSAGYSAGGVGCIRGMGERARDASEAVLSGEGRRVGGAGGKRERERGVGCPVQF